MKTTFVTKKYRVLLLAGLLGWIVCMVGDMADTIFAGIFIGEDAVSAVAPVTPVFSILMCLCTLIGAGTTTLYSRAAGAFDKEKAYKVAGMGVLLSLILGVLLALLMILGEDAYFAFYSSSPEVEALAREYYNCFYILAFIYPIYWEMYYLVSADADATLCVAADVATAGLNVLFSILFVNKLGIKGLALGTVASLLLSSVFIIAHFFLKTNSIHFKMSFNLKDFGKMCAIGSSSSLSTFYLAITDIVINKYLITHFSDKYLAAYSVVNLILNLACCFLCVIDAAGPFISVSYGEKNPNGIRKIMNLSTKYALGIGLLFLVVLEALATVLPKLYGITNPEIYDAAVYSGRVLPISMVVTALVYEWGNYYPKVDKVVLGNISSAIYMLIAPLVFVPLIANQFGYEGLVWGFFLTPFASLVYIFIHVVIKYGVKNFPYIIDEVDTKIFTYDLQVNEDGIVETNNKMQADLQSIGVDDGLINKIQLLAEETLMIVHDRNEGKKILADCTVMVDDEKISLITRDNGEVFDVTEVNGDIKTFREYVTAQLMTSGQENSYLLTTSFNRNCFIWELN